MSNSSPWLWVVAGAVMAGTAYYAGTQSSHEVSTTRPARAADPAPRLRIIEELKISDHELLRLVAVPDPYLPYNCVLLTDSTAGKTTMFCPDTGAVSSSPP